LHFTQLELIKKDMFGRLTTVDSHCIILVPHTSQQEKDRYGKSWRAIVFNPLLEREKKVFVAGGAIILKLTWILPIVKHKAR
jgi:hypothetical protein